MKVAYNKAHVGDVLLVQLAMEPIVKTAMDPWRCSHPKRRNN